MWEIIYTKLAQKDAKKLSSAGLRPKTEQLLAILKKNPYQKPPPYEKLVGDLAGAYSRRINIQHRLIYQVISAGLPLRKNNPVCCPQPHKTCSVISYQLPVINYAVVHLAFHDDLAKAHSK